MYLNFRIRWYLRGCYSNKETETHNKTSQLVCPDPGLDIPNFVHLLPAAL